MKSRTTLKPGEGIYGFGFTDDEEVNRRGKDLLLVQTNIGIIIPVMLSTEGYGVLWDTYSQMRFTDGPRARVCGPKTRRAGSTII